MLTRRPERQHSRERRARRRRRPRGARPARAPVRSSTVDGVARQLARRRRPRRRRAQDLLRASSSSARGSGPPWRFALVAATAPTAIEHLLAVPSAEPGRGRRSSPGWSPAASGSAAPGSGGRACTGPAGASRAIAPIGRELRHALEAASRRRRRRARSAAGRARPFSAYSRCAGSSRYGVAQSPYTVSVGRTTGLPARSAATALVDHGHRPRRPGRGRPDPA